MLNASLWPIDDLLRLLIIIDDTICIFAMCILTNALFVLDF